MSERLPIGATLDVHSLRFTPLRRVGWLALVALATLAACSRTPDERRIRDAIGAMQTAAEAHRPSDFLEHVAADFTANSGELDRTGLANLLRVEMLRNEKIGSTIGPIAVELSGDRATATFTLTLTGGSGWLPEHGAVYAITTGWRREGRDWMLYNASWKQQL